MVHSPRRTWRTVLLAATLTSAAGLEAQPRSAIGLSPAFARLFLEQGVGHDAPGAQDEYGFAVASGDFNGDGYDDLAVGIPGNDCDFVVWDCGSLQVRLGGLAASLETVLVLNPGWNSEHPAEENEMYGRALAAGDFDADGRADLAVGVPFQRWPVNPDWAIGAVHVHRGLPGSIEAVASGVLEPGLDGMPGGDGFTPFSLELGTSLAVGDFNGDGFDDLAMGAPVGWVDGAIFAGLVFVAHGHPDQGFGAGLVPYAGFEIYQGTWDVPGVAENGDDFGDALAVGDFNGDGFDDLAIGVPKEDGSGVVEVVYGSANSLILSGAGTLVAPRLVAQTDMGMIPEEGDAFGAALVAGDFNDDGWDDLAIGVPGKNGGALGANVGLVAVVPGNAFGLLTNGTKLLWEDVLHGGGHSEPDDFFGTSLAAGDFDGDGIDDLAIGTPGEDLIGANEAGSVTVVLGRPINLFPSSTPRRRLTPDIGPPPVTVHSGMIPDLATGGPHFGKSLASGDFDGNGFADLAIGAHLKDLPGQVNVGAVGVLFGQLFVDGFETGDLFEWSASTP